MKRYIPWVVVGVLVLISVIVSISLYGTNTRQSPGWNDYTSSDASFTIQFPQQPTDRTYTKKVDGTDIELQYQSYNVKDTETHREYLVNVVEYPPEVNIQEYPLRTLESSIGGVIDSQKGNTLLFSEPMQIQDYTAARYGIENKDEGYFIHGMGVIVDNKQYIIMAQLEEDDREHFDTFASSFQLH